MKKTRARTFASLVFALVTIALTASACGGGGAAASPSAAPTKEAPTLDAPAEVGAGTEFDVSWTGPGGNRGDYVTIVAKGATTWTDEAYVNIIVGSPGKLLAPTTPGEYELLCVVGDTLDDILTRRPITVK